MQAGKQMLMLESRSEEVLQSSLHSYKHLFSPCPYGKELLFLRINFFPEKNGHTLEHAAQGSGGAAIPGGI